MDDTPRSRTLPVTPDDPGAATRPPPPRPSASSTEVPAEAELGDDGWGDTPEHDANGEGRRAPARYQDL